MKPPIDIAPLPRESALDPQLRDGDGNELARAAREGSLGAFERLYRSYAPLVLALTKAALPSAHEVEDVAAEAFVRALERLDSFDPDRGSFRVWLLTIARNAAGDRRRARRAEPMSPAEIEQRLAHEATVEENAGTEIDPGLAAHLGRLSPSQRQVIVLRYLVGLNSEECARILGKSTASVHQHHHMALRALAEALEPAAGGERRTQAMSRIPTRQRRLGHSFTALPRASRGWLVG